MKNIVSTSYLFIALSLLSCNTEKKHAAATKNKQLTFQNTLSKKRVQEPISITKSRLTTILGEISNDSVPALFDSNGSVIPFQLEDIDNDGNWDQYLSILDFEPNETVALEVKKVSKKEIPSFTNYTNIRFGIGKDKKQVSEVHQYERTGDPREKDSLFFQMEGPAWENDKVGFRFYFDPRNGIDIFGKTTSKMVLDNVGLHSNYHELESWGMDVLKVGTSLGAGAIAVTSNNGTLQRITGVEKTTFNIVAEGPVKSVFEMIYSNTKIGNQIINITHRISITKGQWGYKSEIFFSGIKEPINLVTGIVNLKPNIESSEKVNNHFILKSFGKQSENHDQLGMAVLVNEQDYIKHFSIDKTGTDISSSYLVEMKATNTKPATFHFLTGWEKSNSMFSTATGFDTMLNATIEKIKNPIVIK